MATTKKRRSPEDYRPEAVLRDRGITVRYTTGEAARILGRHPNALLYALYAGRYVDRDGNPIRVERDGGQYIWTPDDVLNAAVSMFNFKRSRISLDQLKSIIGQLLKDGDFDGKFD